MDVDGYPAPKTFPIAAMNPFLILVPISLGLKSSSTNGTISFIPPLKLNSLG